MSRRFTTKLPRISLIEFEIVEQSKDYFINERFITSETIHCEGCPNVTTNIMQIYWVQRRWTGWATKET